MSAGGACEDRGADLFALARHGGAPEGDLGAHLASCAGCAAELAALKRLAAALPAATPRLSPRPESRDALRFALAGTRALAPPRRGRLLRIALPAGLAAAAAAAGLFVALRPPLVQVVPLWGAEGIAAASEGGVRAGTALEAGAHPAAFRLGSPFNAEVVLDAGARVVPIVPRSGPLRLEVRKGKAWFHVSWPRTRPSIPELVVGGITIAANHGTDYALELLPDGRATAWWAGPRSMRVDVPAGRTLLEAEATTASEPTDATDWFAYPVVGLREEPAAHGEGRDLVVTLTPSCPFPVRLAPWVEADPTVTLRIRRDGKGPLREVRVRRENIRLFPPGGEPDGAFLLSASTPYILRVALETLDLARGSHRVEAVYAAHRPGGLWRGERVSAPLTVDAR